LKKRTKKLLPVSVRASLIGRANQQNKSFLFLFFKKEILPCFINAPIANVAPAILSARGTAFGSSVLQTRHLPRYAPSHAELSFSQV
jgi:hypothetical protein